MAFIRTTDGLITSTGLITLTSGNQYIKLGGSSTLITNLSTNSLTTDSLTVDNNLVVQGNFTVHGTTTTLNTTVETTSAMSITNAGTGPALVVNQTGSQPILDIQDDGNNALYIEDGGYIGIGTNNPAALLHLYASGGGDGTFVNGILIENSSTTVGEPCLQFKNAGTGGTGTDSWKIGLNQDNELHFNYGDLFTDDHSKMVIKSDGKVTLLDSAGFGPSYELTIGGGDSDKIELRGSTNPTITFSEWLAADNQPQRAHIKWNATNNALQFQNLEADSFDFYTHANTGAIALRLKGSDGDVWGYLYGEEGSSAAHQVGLLDGDANWAIRHVKDSFTELKINNSRKLLLKDHGLLHDGGYTYPLVLYPNKSWGASGTSTGRVVISLPGENSSSTNNSGGNYGMFHIVIDTYEYNSQAATTYIVGGHTWSKSWYNTNITKIGDSKKDIKLGYDLNTLKYVIVIGEANDTWSYGSVHVRKITNATYYATTWDSTDTNFTITQVTSADSAFQNGGSTGLSNPLQENSLLERKDSSDNVTVGIGTVNQANNDNVKVGIGITNPSVKLSFGTSTDDDIYLFDNGTSGAAFGIGMNSAGFLNVYGGSSGNIALRTNGPTGTVMLSAQGTDQHVSIPATLSIGTVTASEVLNVDGTSTLDGFLFNAYNNNAYSIRSATTGSTGLILRDSGANWKATVYGDGNNHGFLNAAWGGWSLKKVNNGALYLNANSTYYLQPEWTSLFKDFKFHGTMGQTDVNNSFIRESRDLIDFLTRIGGRQVFHNSQWIAGTESGIGVYNNASTNAVTLDVIAASSDSNVSSSAVPNSTGYVLKISYDASASTSPNYGGFYSALGNAEVPGSDARYKKKNRLVHKIWAKIPSGRSIYFHSNAYGNSGSFRWVTSQAGTGDWEQYIGLQQIGQDGSGAVFSNTGYYSIGNGSATAFDWYVAEYSVIDVDCPPEISFSSGLSIGNSTGTAFNSMNAGWGGLGVRSKILLGGDLGSGTITPNKHAWAQRAITVQAQGTNQYSAFEALGTGTGAGALLLGNESILRASIIGADGSHLTFATNTNNTGTSQNEKMRITAAGKVGIGTNDPSEELHVFSDSDPTIQIGGGVADGTTGGTATLKWRANNGTNGNIFAATYYKDANQDRITFWDGGAVDVLTLKNGGNVGIGMTNPGQLLTLKGQGHTTPTFAIERSNSTITQFRITLAESSAATTSRGTSTGQWANVIDSYNSNLVIASANISGSGGTIALDSENVGIGTTDPSPYKLYVTGDVYSPNLSRKYNLPNTAGSSTWVKIGVLNTTQSGRNLYLKIIAASGYNANAAQNQVSEVYFRTSNNSSNQSTVSGGGFYGSASFSRTPSLGTQTTAPSQIRIIQTPSSTSEYEFWGFFGSFTGTGSFYEVSTDVNDTWTNSASLSSSEPNGGTGTYITLVSGNVNTYGNGLNGRVAVWNGTYSLGYDGSFYWDTANNRLGIGTSPDYQLHNYNSATTAHHMFETGTAGNTSKLIFKTTDNSDLSKYIAMESYYMVYSGNQNEGFIFKDSANTELLKIYASNNTPANKVSLPQGVTLGVGTSTPNADIGVLSDGSAAGGAELRLQHANNNSTDVVGTVNFANNVGSVSMIQGGTTGANNTGYISFHTDNAGTSSEKYRITGAGTLLPGGDATYSIGSSSARIYETYSSRFYAADGGNSSPTFSFANDTNTGMYRENTDKLGFTTAGTHRMIIDADGRVGIGTTEHYDSATLGIKGDTINIGDDNWGKFYKHVTNLISANGTQARRAKILDVAYNTFHWQVTANFIIELYGRDYAGGLYQKWMLETGYLAGGGTSNGDTTDASAQDYRLRLLEARGYNTRYAKLSLGAPVDSGLDVSSYDNFILPVYVDVDYYFDVVAVVTHASGKRPIPIGDSFTASTHEYKFYSTPSYTNISSFQGDANTRVGQGLYSEDGLFGDDRVYNTSQTPQLSTITTYRISPGGGYNRIHSRLGVGTSSNPSYMLDVRDDNDFSTNLFRLFDSNVHGTILVTDANELVINDSSSTFGFRIKGNTNANLFKVDTNNQRVGIGTTPDNPLHIEYSGATTTQGLFIHNTNNANDAGIKFSDVTSHSQNGIFYYAHSDSHSNGTENSFHFNSDQSTLAVILDQTSGNCGYYIGETSPVVAIRGGGGSFFNGGNVGVGTTDPATAKFEIHQNSGNTFKIFGQSALEVFGVGATGQTTITGQTGLTVFGITNSGAGDFMNVGGGSLYVKKDGKVGIGTTDPAVQLNVYGTDAEFRLQRAGGSYTGIMYQGFPSGLPFIAGDNELAFGGAGTWTEHMRITSGGNVGIGTSAPTSTLEVSGTDTVFTVNGTNGTLFSIEDDLSDSLMSINDAAGLPVFEAFADSSIVAGRYNQSDFHLTSAGNVGLGTTNVLTKLHVHDSNDRGILLDTYNCLLGKHSSNDTFTQLIYWTGDIAYYGRATTAPASHSVSQHQFRTGGTTRLTLTTSEAIFNDGGFNYDFRIEGDADADLFFVDAANDEVGIGTTDPRAKLDVRGDFSVAPSSTSGTFKFRVMGSAGSGGIYMGDYNNDLHWYVGVDDRGGSGTGDNALVIREHSSEITTPGTGSEYVTIGQTGNVGIGTSQPGYKLEVNGTAHVVSTFTAGTKSFLIDHPTKENHLLQYGSLEGPEYGVYVRGTTTSGQIELPEVWTGLVDEDTITVNFTARGKFLPLYLDKVEDNIVYVGGTEIGEVYDYVVYGTRKDVDPLEVELIRPTTN